MGAMNNLMVQIQNEILRGELSFSQIAEEFNIPLSWVNEAADELMEQEGFYSEYAHDQLERDHDEPYEPEPAEDRYLDSSYEDRYDLGDHDYA